METGIFFAILTILFFGSWAVPTKTLKIKPEVQAFWLTVGHFILSGIVFIFVAQPLKLNEATPSFIAGFLWGMGIISGYIGIKHLGITRALGIWVPLIILTSTLWGLFYFGEIWNLQGEKLTLTAVGIFLLIIAALAVIHSSKGEDKIKNARIGILASAFLGLIHGSYFVPATSKYFAHLCDISAINHRYALCHIDNNTPEEITYSKQLYRYCENDFRRTYSRGRKLHSFINDTKPGHRTRLSTYSAWNRS